MAAEASPTRPEREDEVIANSTAAARSAREALLLTEAGEGRERGRGLGSTRVVTARGEGGKLGGEESGGDELSVEQHGPGAVLTVDGSKSSNHVGGPSGGGSGDGGFGGGAVGDGNGGREDRGFQELWKALDELDAALEEDSPLGMIDDWLGAPGVADADAGLCGYGGRERDGRERAGADSAVGLDAPAGADGSCAAAAAAAATVYGSGVGHGGVGNGGRGSGSGAEGKSGPLAVTEVQAPVVNERRQLDAQSPELRAEEMMATLTVEDTRVSDI